MEKTYGSGKNAIHKAPRKGNLAVPVYYFSVLAFWEERDRKLV